jgi:hypothetical protein
VLAPRNLATGRGSDPNISSNSHAAAYSTRSRTGGLYRTPLNQIEVLFVSRY